MKVKILFLLLLFCTAFLYGQSKGILFSVDGKSFLIGSVTSGGQDYISLNKFADSLKVGKFYNPSSSKFELKFENSYLKFTGGNPFVVITDRRNNSNSVIQLPAIVLSSDDDLFIPLKWCTELLSGASEKTISFKEVLIENHGEIPKEKQKESVETGPVKYDISRLTYDVKANGTLIKIKLNKKNVKYTHSVDKNVLYLNLAGLTCDEKELNKIYPKGLIKSLSVKNIQKNSQLAFTLNEGYSTSEVFHDTDSDDLIITIHNKLLSNAALNLTKNIEKWNLNTVVIDAGHGGKDPGAIGINGVKEKDINLAIAIKLGALIEKELDGTNVVYTRSTDKFVELYKRGKLANENNGKLFISIHCNSTPRKPTNRSGFEIYLLRPGRTTEAISIAERENSVIEYEDNPSRYQELTDENFILVSMAHSSYMRYSEQFSDLLNKQFTKSLSIPSQGIKQAGFYVLVGASMPNVLIETGFLSNRKDAEYLSSKKGQQSIAQSIFEAVKEFKTSYDQALSH